LFIGPQSAKKSRQDEDGKLPRAGASRVGRRGTSKPIAQARPPKPADADLYQRATHPALNVAEQVQDGEDLPASLFPDPAQLSGTGASHTGDDILLPVRDLERLQDVVETAETTGQNAKPLPHGTKEAAAKAAVSSRNSQIWMSLTLPSAQRCNDN